MLKPVLKSVSTWKRKDTLPGLDGWLLLANNWKRVHCPVRKLGESALYEEDKGFNALEGSWVSLPYTRKTKGTLPCEEEEDPSILQ